MQMVKLPALCGEPQSDYRPAMRLCLFEPEIAGNVGAVMRLGACFGVAVDLIEPLGFDWDDKRVRRTAVSVWKRASPVGRATTPRGGLSDGGVIEIPFPRPRGDGG